MKKMTYSIKIEDQTYTISTDESEAIFTEAVALVTTIMHDMYTGGLKDARSRAVMAALQIAIQLTLEKNKVVLYEEQLQILETWVMHQDQKLTQADL